MNEIKLKNQVSIFLIVSQFTLVIIVFICHLFGGYTFSELTDTIALMLPMLTIYTSGMLKYIISTRNDTVAIAANRQVNKTFVFLIWFLTGLFVFSLLTIILLAAYKYISDFEQFKVLLVIIETSFGAFTGSLVSALID
ncbi:MAG: hypothetical protein AAFQ80_08610 [Cyanobacteria bacterium J06621_8]